jgi:glycine C-acetyltransferase
MPMDRLHAALSTELDTIAARGSSKRHETVVVKVLPPAGGKGPRFLAMGEGDKPFIKMNGNSYLGVSRRPEGAPRRRGRGARIRGRPGSRAFHQRHARAARRAREAARRVPPPRGGDDLLRRLRHRVSTIVPLITAETAVISDALNHNCIINAMRLARPKEKYVYQHSTSTAWRSSSRPPRPPAASAPWW